MSKKQSIIIIICVIALGVLGFLGYKALELKYKKDLDAALEQEKAKNEELEDKIDYLTILTGSTDLIEDEDNVSGDDSGTRASDGDIEVSESIDEIEDRIASFFIYLDEQDYIKQYNLTGNSYDEYEKIIQKLSEKKPLAGNETESLYNMFLNIAHFYRVLGSEDLSLIKDLLTYENENIESTMRDFYLWYTYDSKDRKSIKGRPSQQILYEYAGFFLNTIGGRNYLMRRDSKIRILTSYYCLLILDRANDLKQNPEGIDIRPYLRLTAGDLSDKSGFIFHREYMKNLKKLMEKYNID